MSVTENLIIPDITVLHVVDSLQPGGMENGVVNVALRLAGTVRTHVACLQARGSFADRLPDPMAVTLLGKKAGFSVPSVLALERTIRRLRPSLVHSHNLGPLIYASLATLGGRTVPIVHGEHGQIQPQDLSPRRLFTRKALYRFCNTVHTVSAPLLGELQGMGLRSNQMTAINNGVDCEKFHPADNKVPARTALGLAGEKIVTLGIVGRFVALKRHLLLLEALAELMATHPSVHLLVVGDNGGEREKIIAAMRSHPFAGRIHWLGMRSDMPACYQAMDLLVSPSEVEGLSNAVLEAMACGVPVLAHHACGSGEAIIEGEGGYLRDLQSASALSAILRDILSRPSALHEQGAKARKRVERDFSIDAMAEGYLRLYRKIAGGG